MQAHSDVTSAWCNCCADVCIDRYNMHVLLVWTQVCCYALRWHVLPEWTQDGCYSGPHSSPIRNVASSALRRQQTYAAAHNPNHDCPRLGLGHSVFILKTLISHLQRLSPAHTQHHVPSQLAYLLPSLLPRAGAPAHASAGP
jgi:hypothetical protein